MHSIRHKLMLLVGITTLTLVVLTAASALIAARVEVRLSAIESRYLPKVELEGELDRLFASLQRGFQDAVAAHDTEALAANAEIEQTFLRELAAHSDALDAAKVAALRSALEDYYGAAYDVSRRMISDETGESIVVAASAMQEKQIAATNALASATSFDRRELTTAFATAGKAVRFGRNLELGVSIACVVGALVVATMLGREFLRALGALTAGFARIGEGNFTDPIAVRGRDELAELANHANHMASRLARLTEERGKAAARFRALIEAAPDAMVITDAAGRVVLVNAQTERLFGYTREELLGQDSGILVAGGAPGSGVPKLIPTRPDIELLGRGKDGSEFPLEVSQSPLETEDGAVVSSAIRDITERKRVEDALKLSNRELEAFSYAVAHDLRAPLRGINGFSQTLLEDYGEKLDGEARDYLSRIAAGARRMGQLIDALLSLSRVTRTELLRETVNLSELADAIVKQLRTTQPARTVEFALQDGVLARGDGRLLRALLENLLGNAWKFTGAQAGAHIAFGTEENGGNPVYYVSDDGAGFDMAYADKLFAPFQRLHSAKDFAGTGVGLATVQRIVDRHGGRIWAEGAVGRGATFRFTLAPIAGGNIS
jgi:PAS domain S-box-containing protein